MPNNPFKFEVSTVKPTAVVFADTFLRKPIKKFLRKKGISIRSPKTAKSEKIIDYVIDANRNPEALKLARRQGTKYLAISQNLDEEFDLTAINGRVIRTDFLIGADMPLESVVGQMLSASIRNETIILPAGKDIFPLHVEDLANAVWQALVMPNTAGKEFLILGQPIDIKQLGKILKNLGQTTEGIAINKDVRVIDYSKEKLQESALLLDWQPRLEPQQALQKAFQSLISDPRLKKKQKPKQYLKVEIEEPEKVYSEKKEAGKRKPKLKKEAAGEIASQSKEIQESKKDDSVIAKFIPEFKKYQIKQKAKPKKKDEEIIIIEEGPKKDSLVLDKNDEIEQLINQLEATKQKSEQAKKQVRKKEININWKKFILTPLIFFLIVFISTWIKPICATGLGVFQTKAALVSGKNQNWEKSKRLSQKAKKNFQTANIFIKDHPLSPLIFGVKKQIEQISKAGIDINKSIEIALPLTENLIRLTDNILHGKENNFHASINQIQASQRQLSWQLASLAASIKASWDLPPRWKKTPNQWADNLNQIIDYLNKSEKLIDNLAWITGADNHRRTFLVLLQNNMELRPTGGFIGSFALITFQDGALIDFDVKDVYAADGQLKGHVEPPKQIKEILGEANWYLRDSNWDPDFIESAKDAEWFLSKELGRDVDGVIGFNLEAAKKMLDAFGEIYLADFNEKISSDNLFERAEFWTENEFFSGSTQKMAFLGLLGQQLFESIKAAKPEEHLKLARALIDSLEENEITIYAHDPKLAFDLHSLGWDGTIKQPKCAAENCINDYLFLVEANLGVNKANYFLRRNIEQIIDIKSTNKIEQIIKINYENTASSNNWPGGKYVNWMRVLMPPNKQIESITITDPLNPKIRQTIPVDQRTEEIINNKKILGFKMEVPINQRRTVEIRLSQQVNLNPDSFSYVLYWQKQPGYQETPVSVLISFPDTWQPVQVNPAASIVSGKLLFNPQFSRDLNLGAAFEQ